MREYIRKIVHLQGLVKSIRMDVLVCEAACLELPPLAASLLLLYDPQLEISKEVSFMQEDILHKLVGDVEL
jgi:hypothetical protein